MLWVSSASGKAFKPRIPLGQSFQKLTNNIYLGRRLGYFNVVLDHGAAGTVATIAARSLIQRDLDLRYGQGVGTLARLIQCDGGFFANFGQSGRGGNMYIIWIELIDQLELHLL